MPTAIIERTAGKIKTIVVQTVTEILNDPDFGLELTVKARKRLSQAPLKKAGTIPLSIIKHKYL